MELLGSMHQMTPYPASFAGGDGLLLYAWALGSITSLACLMIMISGWMARDIWRDRFIIHPSNPVTAFRLILMLASFTSFIRAMPEAVYLFLWNEVSAGDWQFILTMKRIADGMAIFPGVLWPILLALTYPGIVNALKTSGHFQNIDLMSPWPRLVRPAFALLLAFVIALLVAVSKLYLGVQGGVAS